MMRQTTVRAALAAALVLIASAALAGCTSTDRPPKVVTHHSVIAKPPVVHHVTVPSLIGRTEDDAIAVLDELGLDGSSNQDPNDEHGGWVVTAQVPDASSSELAGDPVVLTLAVPQVVYTVTGNGRTSNVVTYTKPGTTDIEQQSNAPLPWSVSFDEPDGSSLENYWSVSAQDEAGTSISCSISDAGKVVDSETATGRYAIVQCSNN